MQNGSFSNYVKYMRPQSQNSIIVEMKGTRLSHSNHASFLGQLKAPVNLTPKSSSFCSFFPMTDIILRELYFLFFILVD